MTHQKIMHYTLIAHMCSGLARKFRGSALSHRLILPYPYLLPFFFFNGHHRTC